MNPHLRRYELLCAEMRARGVPEEYIDEMAWELVLPPRAPTPREIRLDQTRIMRRSNILRWTLRILILIIIGATAYALI